jgi:hypothetical protein
MHPARGGGRWVDVAPERFPGWIAGFQRRHGAAIADPGPEAITFRAADGAVAECHLPFPPMGPPGGLAVPPAGPGTPAAQKENAGPGGPAEAWAEAAAAHAGAARTVGVLLVRLGGYAAGVFSGSPPALIASKTGARPVHGRSAAGGWSQHRFARRRENQASAALRAAASAAEAVLGRYRADLDAVVLGGDKRAVAGLRGETALRPYMAIATSRFLTVPDPRLAVLRSAPAQFRAIRVRLAEP